MAGIFFTATSMMDLSQGGDCSAHAIILVDFIHLKLAEGCR
jgi:hypothetical protein